MVRLEDTPQRYGKGQKPRVSNLGGIIGSDALAERSVTPVRAPVDKQAVREKLREKAQISTMSTENKDMRS